MSSKLYDIIQLIDDQAQRRKEGKHFEHWIHGQLVGLVLMVALPVIMILATIKLPFRYLGFQFKD